MSKPTKEELLEAADFYCTPKEDGLTDWQRYKRDNYCSLDFNDGTVTHCPNCECDVEAD